MREPATGVLEEQAALRRVATLVARGERPNAVFAAVAEEVAGLLAADGARVVRYIDDQRMLQLEGWTVSAHPPLPLGPVAIEGRPLPREVLRTGRAVSIGNYTDFPGPAAYARDLGLQSAAAAPIVVDGHLWGAMITWVRHPRMLPANAESRLVAFTELIGMAISNTVSGEEVARLAEEQAALRRVATLVAGGALPEAVSEAVAEEVKLLLPADYSVLGRYEGDEMVIVASAGLHHPAFAAGEGITLGGDNVATTIHRTGRSARADTFGDDPGQLQSAIRSVGARSTVGTPILVAGRLWGMMLAGTTADHVMPPDTEARLASFTELVAMAIGNTDARVELAQLADELAQLADEQAALRRVATMVAREASPAEVFATVAEEIGRLLGAEAALMHRYESSNETVVIASWGRLADAVPIGSRWTSDATTVQAVTQQQTAVERFVDYAAAERSVAACLRAMGVQSAVGGPIIVDGQLWGVLTAATFRPGPMPSDAESRIEKFTELVATAISNVEARTALVASRARLIAAADDERRRVVRDIHDGAQQRLMHTVLALKLARRALGNNDDRAPALVQEGLEHAERANAELRELAHGILPAVLARGGLRAGVSALAVHMPIPVEIEVGADRLPQLIEATAYFVVAEALTNIAKHAHADRAAVAARIEGGALRISIRDDGVGGAQLVGSGLVGLADRLAALDGRLNVESGANRGTILTASIPLPDASNTGLELG
jgi:signal transduction histidine kinase